MTRLTLTPTAAPANRPQQGDLFGALPLPLPVASVQEPPPAAEVVNINQAPTKRPRSKKAAPPLPGEDGFGAPLRPALKALGLGDLYQDGEDEFHRRMVAVLNGVAEMTPENRALRGIMDVATWYYRDSLTKGHAMDSPQFTRRYLSAQLKHRPAEAFTVLFLDNRHRLIESETLFHGTIDGASVYPREVVRRALHHNAAALIFAHNHPSGRAEPSRADEQITRRLKDALALIDVRVLDHIIVGDDSTVSLAERGLM